MPRRPSALTPDGPALDEAFLAAARLLRLLVAADGDLDGDSAIRGV